MAMTWFHVYDREGNDVTADRKWAVMADGTLIYLTDNGYVDASDDYWYGD